MPIKRIVSICRSGIQSKLPTDLNWKSVLTCSKSFSWSWLEVLSNCGRVTAFVPSLRNYLHSYWSAAIKMLPPSLRWFSYQGVIDDLGEYLKKKIPVGHSNIVLFARNITIKSDIDLRSTYHRPPIDLTLLCETLEVQPKTWWIFETGNNKIDLSAGKNAPDLWSFHDEKGGAASQGKAGCAGGSIAIYAKIKTGDGKVDIDVRGGDGGKAQAGYVGKPGKKAEDTPWYNPFTTNDGGPGEDGGNGGKGGRGGDAGDIDIVFVRSETSDLLDKSSMKGGHGGQGGAKGKGGVGGAGGGWWWGQVTQGKKGKDGADGQDGPVGDSGKDSQPELHQMNDVRAFYQYLPLSGAYLQRALNSEMYRIMHAKSLDNKSKLHEAESNVIWIRKIAESAGYSVITRRCKTMLELCHKDVEISKDVINIESAKVRDHLEEMKQVGQKTADLHPTDLNKTIHNDELLKKHVHYALLCNRLGSHFKGCKDRYNKAKDLAKEVNDAPSIDTDTEKFLSTPFAQQLSEKLKIAASEMPCIKAAKAAGAEGNLEGIGGSIPASFPELLEGLELAEVLGMAAAALAEALPFIAAGAVVVGVTALAGYAVYKLVEDIGSLFEVNEEELEKYEEAVRQRAKLEKRNRINLKRDEDLPDAPTRRRPYLRPRRRTRPPRTPEEPPIPIEEFETGKFIGVLDKCEPVETEGSDQVVATFDSIPIELTTIEPEMKVDVNALDPIQKVEFMAQLELQSIPFGILPAFTITTTLPKETVGPDALGQWFEFNAQFEGAGKSFGVEVTPLVSYILGKLSHTAAAIADANMPVTIQATERLTPKIQETIIEGLRLTPDDSPVFAEKSASDPIDTVFSIMNVVGESISSTLDKRGHSTSKQELSSAEQPEDTTKVVLSTLSKVGDIISSAVQEHSKPSPEIESSRKVQTASDLSTAILPQVPKVARVVNKVLVANVGQGSCNVLFDGQGPVLVYDLGGSSGLITLESPLMNDIKNASTFVISHWDLDHYRILLSDQDLAESKTIYAPAFGSRGGPCVRRVSFGIRSVVAVSDGEYHSFNRYQQLNIPEIRNLDLHMTTCTDSSKSKNNFGAITLCVMNSHGQPYFLMPGDASYCYVADVQKSSQGTSTLKYLVATHHGSRYSIKNYGGETTIPAPGNRNNTVFYSYGENNSYGHSIENSESFYSSQGWTNFRSTVDSTGKGIHVHLNL